MKKISFISDFFRNNECFDPVSQYNRDDFLYFIQLLKVEFEKKNVEIGTQDIIDAKSADCVLFNESCLKYIHHNNNNYLLAIESPFVIKDNNNPNNARLYRKIFTWDDRLVDNKKYFKVNYAFNIPQSIPKYFSGKKLCTTIAGNKNSVHPDELYSKRRELIKWFEMNHPLDFDLYGTAWNQRNFGSTLLGKVLNRFSFLKTFHYNAYPSYKGMVDSKFDTFSQYKFAICYENIKDQPGYIKIIKEGWKKRNGTRKKDETR